MREGRYQALVSFMLRIETRALPQAQRAPRRAQVNPADRYAAHSVLATGNWAKIRVPSTGVYQLTESVIKAAGFSDLSKVKIYGYGGNLQNERLVASDLIDTDDLKEVPTYTVGGKRLFYARGPVSWTDNKATRRTRNFYSNYGYYFITQSDGDPLAVDSTTFFQSFYPSASDYHQLYEKDGFAWYNGGRNLFDPETIVPGGQKKYVFHHPSTATSATLSVNVTAGVDGHAQVLLNGKVIGNITLYLSDKEQDKGTQTVGNYTVSQLSPSDTVTVKSIDGDDLHLDYISWTYDKPAPSLSMSTTSPTRIIMPMALPTWSSSSPRRRSSFSKPVG